MIEAARRAKPVLEAGEFTLLPLVLNVSEVSASLDTRRGRGDDPEAADRRAPR